MINENQMKHSVGYFPDPTTLESYQLRFNSEFGEVADKLGLTFAVFLEETLIEEGKRQPKPGGLTIV